VSSTQDELRSQVRSRCLCVVPGSAMATALDLLLRRSRVRCPAVPVSRNNLGQVVRTHVPRSSRIKQHNFVYRSRGDDASLINE